ncbi:LANO_0C04566g1_1 [Lachancea nothofagi CBS 11611]|uniref:LANO_0C04566g1_1 n=1 Tax=Lachancea nothofagi CBS 11611 TaxID=1266666 RepID=A0A1G4J713_9SACH|nr:LANO_0C04566g1_1 [Lachancea nothofagi CBS 11611]
MTKRDAITADKHDRQKRAKLTAEDGKEDINSGIDEEDYMTMIIGDDSPVQAKHQTQSQSQKVDRNQEQASKILPKGFAMMSKMGFKLGEALGQNEESAIKEPISASIRRGPRGINISQQPSKEENSSANEADFQRWTQNNGERSKKMHTLHKMQKMALELSGDVDRFEIDSDPRDFNCLWRRYVMELQQKLKPPDYSIQEKSHQSADFSSKAQDVEAKVAQHRELYSSSLRNRDQDTETKLSPSRDSSSSESERDEELSIFEELSIDQQVLGVHTHLRTGFFYCIYCGAQYSSEEDLYKNCPGPTEEDHT